MREQQSKITFTEITTNKVNKTAPIQDRESHYAGGGEPPVSRGPDLTYFQSIYNDLTKFYFKTIQKGCRIKFWELLQHIRQL